MNTTTLQTNEVPLSDGRRITVEAANDSDWNIIMNVADKRVGICVMNASTFESAVAEASRIAHGIEADLRWFAARSASEAKAR